MKRFRKNKEGEILIENVIFIVLNLIFLGVLVVFLIQQGSGIVLLEKPTAKQVALLIDSAKPGMIMEIDFTQGKKLAEKNKVPVGDAIKIDNANNLVIIRLSERSGQEYHFFNDISVGAYPNKDNGLYVLTFSREVSKEVVLE